MAHSKNLKVNTSQDQVQLSKLVFTHNWEDPESDHAALNIQSNDVVQAITSGGCNVLGFLLFDPKEIYSVDINPAQSYLLELKIAAIRVLGFKEFAAFAGLTESSNRGALYQKLKPHLTNSAAAFWDHHTDILLQGFIMNGRYERFIKWAGKAISLLQGRKRVVGLFEQKSREAQQAYFDEFWDTGRFRYLFKILFNKKVLARRGLVAEYFTFDDGSRSFAESFYQRSKKAFCNIPIQGNYFLSLYLLGKYSQANEVPAYLKEENFETIKARVDRIRIITAGAQNWIDTMPDNSIDCFALSNICELMSEQETYGLFKAVGRTAKDGARIIFRNLMIPREVPASLQGSIRKNEMLSKQLFNTDRSFVYGKVAAYTVHK